MVAVAGGGVFGGRLGSFRGRIPANKKLECRCSPGTCREALFQNGAFDSLLDDADKREILAISGDYKGRNCRENSGKLCDSGRARMATSSSPLMCRRPIAENCSWIRSTRRTFSRGRCSTFAASEVEIVGALATYSKARVRALTIGATDASRGWTPLEAVSESASTLAEKAKALAGLSRPARRSARVWL